MKLIKTMLAGMILLVFAIGQEMTDGGPPPPPPCDPNAAYPVADPGPDGGCGNYNAVSYTHLTLPTILLV